MHMFLQWCTSLMLIPRDALTSYCKLHAGLFSKHVSCNIIESWVCTCLFARARRNRTIFYFFFYLVSSVKRQGKFLDSTSDKPMR